MGEMRTITEVDVERVRMAVAEAGYPHESIRMNTAGDGLSWWPLEAIPRVVLRKAREIAGIPATNACLACAERWPLAIHRATRDSVCLGPQIDPFDCGADRHG